MAQNLVTFNGASPSGAVLLDDLLTDLQSNLYSGQIGTSRPSYAVAGMIWIDNTTTPWLLKLFDGVADVILGEIDSSNLWLKLKDFPTAVASTYLKRNAGNTGYDAQSVADTAADMAANFANDAISGDKINGGTISGVDFDATSGGNALKAASDADWYAAVPAGMVINTASADVSAFSTTAFATYTDSNHTISYANKLANSKVRVTVVTSLSLNYDFGSSETDTNPGFWQVYGRIVNTVNPASGSQFGLTFGGRTQSDGQAYIQTPMTHIYEFLPNTTDSVTYTLQVAQKTNGATLGVPAGKIIIEEIKQ